MVRAPVAEGEQDSTTAFLPSANVFSQAIAASMPEPNSILTARHSEYIYNFGTKADPSAQSPTAVTRAFGVQAPPKLVGLAVRVAWLSLRTSQGFVVVADWTAQVCGLADSAESTAGGT